MTKILISTGFGAGWSTWNSGEVARYMLTYEPIIEFLEAGGSFTEGENRGDGIDGRKHPLIEQLERECFEKFGKKYVCVLGADDGLVVRTVSGPVRVDEYDGAESITTASDLYEV